MTTSVQDPAAPAQVVPTSNTLGSHVRAYWRRVRGGEMGALPAVTAIIVLVAGFSIARPSSFPTPSNFANIIPQGAAVTIIAMGLIFVLLVGEIDLSAGYASGMCAAVMTALMTERHVDWWIAVPIAIVLGSIIGLLLGSLVAKVGVPSFVVTLAAFLAFQGVLLWLVHEGQVVPIRDQTMLALSNKQMYVWQGWVLLALCVAGYAAVQLRRTAQRAKQGVTHDPYSLVALRVGALAALGGAAVYALSVERSFNPARISLKGVPIVIVVIIVMLVLLTFVLRRTRFGLHLYAVGGNAEAARRAGIPVDRLRISAFVICSTLASIGGIVAASRANSVTANSGGSDVLLYAVGAAVIGGTSLFGGRGRIIDAVLGGAVVAIIANGMTLLQAKAWVTYVVTGSVLLVAATVDALSRKRAVGAGLR